MLQAKAHIHNFLRATIIYFLHFLLVRYCSGYNHGTFRELSSSSSSSLQMVSESTSSNSFSTYDDVILSRYACTRFQPYSREENNPTSNPEVVSQALHCLDIARRAPSGFNAQPFKAIMVSSPEAKKSLSKYCLGPNSNRVLDSDCTVIFLADQESGRNWRWWKTTNESSDKKVKRKEKSRILFTLLFSSGYPLPRFIRSPISFCIRNVFALVSIISRRKLLLPSLTNAETWSVKNTMLFAMTYILSCTSYNLATSPMEGFNMGGIKKEFHIPKRFCIPLIVSTGIPLRRDTVDAQDYMGVSHGKGKDKTTRFPFDDVVFANDYGNHFD